MSLVLAWALIQDEGRFFKKDLDFWGTRKKEETPKLWPEPMAGPVRDLLENPTRENAARYVEWQKKRAAGLRDAMQALEAAKGGKALQYFTRPNCPWCAEQDKALAGLEGVRVVRVTDPELWKKYKVTSTPTLVLEGKEPRIWRGFVPRDRLEKELKDADR